MWYCRLWPQEEENETERLTKTMDHRSYMLFEDGLPTTLKLDTTKHVVKDQKWLGENVYIDWSQYLKILFNSTFSSSYPNPEGNFTVTQYTESGVDKHIWSYLVQS